MFVNCKIQNYIGINKDDFNTDFLHIDFCGIFIYFRPNCSYMLKKSVNDLKRFTDWVHKTVSW